MTASPRAADALLEARARALARPPAVEPSGLVEVLLMTVGDTRLALDLAAVREVLVCHSLARVPDQRHLTGIRNVRGRLVAVADLADLLGVEPGPRPAAHLVVLDDRAGGLGVLVDAAEGIARIPLGEAARPARDSEQAPGLVSGILQGIHVLDVDSLLEDRRLAGAENGSSHLGGAT